MTCGPKGVGVGELKMPVLTYKAAVKGVVVVVELPEDSVQKSLENKFSKSIEYNRQKLDQDLNVLVKVWAHMLAAGLSDGGSLLPVILEELHSSHMSAAEFVSDMVESVQILQEIIRQSEQAEQN